MSPPLSERPTDRDRASIQRYGRDFAGVCGRLHFFLLRTAQLPPPGQKNAAPQEKKCPLAEY